MKRTVGKMLVALMLVAGLGVNTFAATFKDVSATHWAYAGINYMQEKGYMLMSSSGEFFPNEQVSYFYLAEVLAKATGYEDENIVKDMAETKKEEIRANYTKMLPTIQKYAAMYTTWEAKYNEEIAYLLGKGYIKEADLAKFVSKSSAGKEVKQVVEKQDLAAYLVRILAKENTAISQYTTTGFSDQASIAAENRPHVAYLKGLGMIKGDDKGAFNPTQKLTRATTAVMVANVLEYQEKQVGTTEEGTVLTATIDRLVAKGTTGAETESFIILNSANSKKYYTIKHTATVLDASGNKVDFSVLQNGSANGKSVKAVISQSNGVEYVTRLQLTEAVTDSGSGSGNNNNSNNNNNNNNNGSNTGSTITSNKGELLGILKKRENYVFSIQDGQTTKEVTVALDAAVSRNGKTVEIADLKVGDNLQFTLSGTKATKVVATGETSRIEGRIVSILVSAKPQITVSTSTGNVTLAVTADSDLYSRLDRKTVSVRELVLGQKVEVSLDSKEIYSLTVVDAPSAVNYKGTIVGVGADGKFVDVVIEYDNLTDEVMVERRINVPLETVIMVGNKERPRTALAKGMEVLINYQYGEEMYPKQITVLSN